MRAMILAAVLVMSAGAYAGHEDLWQLYSGKDYEAVLAGATARLEESPGDRDLAHLMGRTLFDMGRRDEAMAWLEPLATGEIKDHRYAWSLLCVGAHALDRGDDAAAAAAWRTVRDERLTRNVARNAANNLRGFALDEAFDGWSRRETEHCRFAFSPDHAGKDLDAYAAEHEAAFAELTGFFGGGPETPVRYVVWGSLEEATELCGITSLGFARPSINLIHCLWPQTVGHEMAHVVSYQALAPVARTRLVNEGLAIRLDLTGRDRLALARWAVAEAELDTLDLAAWWDDGAVDEAVFYPVAGAWIDRLLERGGRGKLLDLARDQTLDSARAVYGADLDAWMAEFQADLFPDGTR